MVLHIQILGGPCSKLELGRALDIVGLPLSDTWLVTVPVVWQTVVRFSIFKKPSVRVYG